MPFLLPVVAFFIKIMPPIDVLSSDFCPVCLQDFSPSRTGTNALGRPGTNFLYLWSLARSRLRQWKSSPKKVAERRGDRNEEADGNSTRAGDGDRGLGRRAGPGLRLQFTAPGHDTQTG